MAEDNSTHKQPPQALLRGRLASILSRHPEYSSTDADGQPSISARAIGKVFDAYDSSYRVALLPPEPRQQLELVVAGSDNVISLDQIAAFIVEFTSASPEASPMPSQDDYTGPEQSFMLEGSGDEEPPMNERGRNGERSPTGSQSRSSSNDSVVTSYYRPNQRRRSGNQPQISDGDGQMLNTPPMTPSPFDSSARQRAHPPSGPAPPSSFKPQAPYRRRRSSGGGSDSESEQTSGGFRSRRKTPSSSTNPSPSVATSDTAPSSSGLQTYPSPESPNMKPKGLPILGSAFVFPSRNARRSPPKTNQPAIAPPILTGSPELVEHELDYGGGDSSFSSTDSVEALLARRQHLFEEDTASVSSDVETASMKASMVRSIASSNASMLSPEERLEALQRQNAELNRKLKENDKALLERLNEREEEIQDLQLRVDELKTELQASRKEEKDLKSKERVTGVQMSNFEQEIQKLQRQLEMSKQTYQNMLKQYNEQLAEAEKYRNQLRDRDSRIKYGEQTLAERVKELQKALGENEILQNTNASLTEDLESIRQAHQQLEEQKHENFLLKETIDRLRYEMDQLRLDAANQMGSVRIKGPRSVEGTLSKSLANEFKAKLGDMEDEEVEEKEVQEDLKLEDLETHKVERTTRVEGEDDDYVETIITTSRRRKVGPRAKDTPIVHIDDDKEYADASTQHDPATVSQYRSAAASQTDPSPAPVPQPRKVSMHVQTISKPSPVPRAMTVTATQTDEPPLQALNSQPSPSEAGPSDLRQSLVRLRQEDRNEDAADNSLAVPPKTSSSSTSTFPLDSPPSYETLAADERHKLLQKWHPGLHGIVSGGVKGGISSNLLVEWENVKRELGFECVAIDKTIQASAVNGERDAVIKIDTDDESEEEIAKLGKRGAKKFYNIYNTYVMKQGGEGSGKGYGRWRDALLIGLGAGVALIAVGLNGTEDPRHLANTFIGTHINGPHGRAGSMDTSEAIWLVIEKVVRHGLGAAARAPTYAPT